MSEASEGFLERIRRNREADQPKTPERYVPIERTPDETIIGRYHIPEANREHPAVQEFVHPSAELDTLTDALAHAQDATRAPNRMSLATTRDLFAAPDMTMTLADRYATVNSLLVAARTVLSEGMYPVADNPRDYALGKVESAVSRLGYTMHVEKKPPVVYRDPDK